jgi:hypothetical protein
MSVVWAICRPTVLEPLMQTACPRRTAPPELMWFSAVVLGPVGTFVPAARLPITR